MFRRYSLALLNCLALAGTTFAGVWGTIFSSTMELKALIVSTIALSSLISFAVSVSSSREVAFTRTALSSILVLQLRIRSMIDSLLLCGRRIGHVGCGLVGILFGVGS